MVAHRAYWPGLPEPSNGRASLLYFAAAVPTVGFVHGAADVNPLDAATLGGYAPQSSRPAMACLRWWGPMAALGLITALGAPTRQGFGVPHRPGGTR